MAEDFRQIVYLNEPAQTLPVSCCLTPSCQPYGMRAGVLSARLLFEDCFLQKKPKCPRRNQRQFLQPFTVSFDFVGYLIWAAEHQQQNSQRPSSCSHGCRCCAHNWQLYQGELASFVSSGSGAKPHGMHCHLLETQILCPISVRYFACVAICFAVLPLLTSHRELCM